MMKKFLTILVLGLAVFAVSCSSKVDGLNFTALTTSDVYTVDVGEVSSKMEITVTGKDWYPEAKTTYDVVTALSTEIKASSAESFLKKLVDVTGTLKEYTAVEGITVPTSAPDADATSPDYEGTFSATYVDADEKEKTIKFTVTIKNGTALSAENHVKQNYYTVAAINKEISEKALTTAGINLAFISASGLSGYTGLAAVIANDEDGSDVVSDITTMKGGDEVYVVVTAKKTGGASDGSDDLDVAVKVTLDDFIIPNANIDLILAQGTIVDKIEITDGANLASTKAIVVKLDSTNGVTSTAIDSELATTLATTLTTGGTPVVGVDDSASTISIATTNEFKQAGSNVGTISIVLQAATGYVFADGTTTKTITVAVDSATSFDA